ncbi:MAG: hypothetical protein MI864_19465 [Pseudomonadales bacterium]|nr:hypothetical protein [Pseudomonadales bacterium]
MDTVIEKLYLHKVICAVLLVSVPGTVWFAVSCEVQVILFWPMFIALGLLSLVAPQLGLFHSNCSSGESSWSSYHTILLACVIVFLAVFVSSWQQMTCEDLIPAVFFGLVGIGISFYRSFASYKDVIESQ